MSNNFFSQDDDNNDDFRDIPDEVAGAQSEVPNVRPSRPAAPQQAPVQQQVQRQEPEVQYEEASEEEEDFSSVLSDARQRMEQGRLYEVLMDHDLFGGQGFDEKAVKYVTKQIRNFAKEQMEIMLGMRTERQEVQALAAADFPFNDLEVQILKALASTATNGATAAPEAQQFSGAQAAAAPRRAGLNPIGAKSQAKPVQPKQAAPAKPLTPKAQAPVKREAPRAQNEKEILDLCMELGISREEYDRQYQSFSSALTKPMSQMSEDEIKERQRQIALRSTKQVKNPQAIPMPSPEQEEMLHSQRAQAAAAHPQMQTLMTLLNNQPKKK